MQINIKSFFNFKNKMYLKANHDSKIYQYFYPKSKNKNLIEIII